MKVFLSKRKLEEYIYSRIELDRHKFMAATAKNAARDALHYYICLRPINWWRLKLDEVANNSTEKYISLANLVSDISKENETM